jgi:hypothetical protein
MSATKTLSETSGATGAEIQAVQDGIAKSITVPKKMMEANFRAGSALLSFVGQRMQAQAELLERFTRCDSVEQAASVQSKFLETLISDYSREMSQFIEIARDNSNMLSKSAEEASRAGRAA